MQVQGGYAYQRGAAKYCILDLLLDSLDPNQEQQELGLPRCPPSLLHTAARCLEIGIEAIGQPLRAALGKIWSCLIRSSPPWQPL